jgi:hypothetical protein
LVEVVGVEEVLLQQVVAVVLAVVVVLGSQAKVILLEHILVAQEPQAQLFPVPVVAAAVVLFFPEQVVLVAQPLLLYHPLPTVKALAAELVAVVEALKHKYHQVFAERIKVVAAADGERLGEPVELIMQSCRVAQLAVLEEVQTTLAPLVTEPPLYLLVRVVPAARQLT